MFAPLDSSLMALTAADFRKAAVFVICLVLAVSVHEFSHAFAAHRLGDRTPKAQGRLTLNPVAHADPIGTLVLPGVLALTTGMVFGWGRPVETQPRFYTRRVSMRAGMALVAMAGPLSNLLLAVLTLGTVWGLGQAGVITARALVFGDGGVISLLGLLHAFFSLNVLLFVFNLIPLHPLDGGKVLGWLLGVRRQHIDEFLQRYGGLILLALVFTGIFGIVLAPFFEFGATMFRAVLPNS